MCSRRVPAYAPIRAAFLFHYYYTGQAREKRVTCRNIAQTAYLRYNHDWLRSANQRCSALHLSP
jgi:hypothetical protein